MSADWKDVTGKGGAYLIERAQAVQKSGGTLSPVALQLIQEELERLKFILGEELFRLEPAGHLTAEAITELRALFQARLDTAQRILAVSRGAKPVPVMASQPSSAPAPASAPLAAEVPPAAVVSAPLVPAVPSRSLREFFADRSILIISYAGAFLLIVATLLFELSAFTAVNGTARFVGVFVLDVIFGLAGWACFRLPAMRLVGRTYVAISALMVPLTLIAAWVFLVLRQYGISRDLAVALAAIACAVLYGMLALRLESQGYAVLSVIAIAVAWIAGINVVGLDTWQGALLAPLAGIYLVMAHRWSRFQAFHQQFGRYARWAMHGAAALAFGWTLLNTAALSRGDGWRVVAVTAFVLALVYFGETLLRRDAIAGAVTLALTGLGWIGMLNTIGLEPWVGLLLTPLVGLYILATYRSGRVAALGTLFSRFAEPFITAAAITALGWTLYSAGTLGDAGGHEAWELYAATLAALALLYAVYARLSSRQLVGLSSMVVLGLAWLCLLNGIDLWPWRGLAFTPVMAFYVLIASRRPAIRQLFASRPNALVGGAAVIAEVWSIGATLTAADPSAGSAWYPAAATFAVVASLYGVDTWLRSNTISPIGSMLAFVGAWIAGISALQLGDWRGLALTPIVPLFALVAFLGPSLRPVGPLYARRAEPFIHGVALIAIGWSAVPALDQLTQNQALSRQSYGYLAATFGALVIGYAIYSMFSGRVWMQWTVAIGVTLTTVTLNQALDLSLSALAVELLLLAVGKAVAARFYRGSHMHTFLYVTAAVQAVIAGVIPVEQDWLRAVILLVAGLMGTFMAVDSDRPEWLYLAAGFFTYGWYWLLKVVIPPPPNPGPSTLVLIYSPLPVMYTAIAIGLRRVRGAAWRWPLYAWAGLVALGVIYVGRRDEDFLLLGLALLAYAVTGYIATVLEEIGWGVPAATVLAAGGVLSLLHAAATPPGWYPLAFIALAWLVYLGAFGWRPKGLEHQQWTRMHRYSGLGLLGLTAVTCFTVPELSVAGNLTTLSALAASWLFAGMLLLDALEFDMAGLKYVALITTGGGTYWIARYFNATNPQWYVLAPGLALIASGLLMQNDHEMPAAYRGAYNGAIALGAAALMGITSIQTFDPDLSTTVYTSFLLTEAVAALLIGIGMRSRVLVLAGAAGIALASLRALVLLIQEAPLFIAFGLVAMLLLVGAAALAVLRQRFADARIAMTRSWRDWS